MTTETMPAPVETRERTASDVLLAAARYIEKHGWYQLEVAGQHDHGGVCASNAIARVASGRGSVELMLAAQNRLAIYLTGQDDFGAVWEWNDTPGRTRDEVLTALREAAR